MKKCGTTIEEIAGGDVAVKPHLVSNCHPASPLYATSNVLNDQMILKFTVPDFLKDHAEVATPYARAISVIVAPSETAGSLVVKVVDKNCDSVDIFLRPATLCQPTAQLQQATTAWWLLRWHRDTRRAKVVTNLPRGPSCTPRSLLERIVRSFFMELSWISCKIACTICSKIMVRSSRWIDCICIRRIRYIRCIDSASAKVNRTWSNLSDTNWRIPWPQTRTTSNPMI